MTLPETVRDLVGGKTRSATIPLERAIVGDEIRAQVAGVAQAGGYSVPTQRLELASALRPASIAARLGAQIHIVQGNAVTPKVGTGANGSWLTKTGTLSDSSVTFGSTSFTPHRFSCVVPISFQLWNQGGEYVQLAFRRELTNTLGYGFDIAAWVGLGVSGEPLGLLNHPGFSTVTFSSSATRAKLASFEKTLADNFGEQGVLGWVTSPASREKLRTIDGLTNGGIPLWSDDDRILGRNAFASPAVHAATARLRTEVVLGERRLGPRALGRWTTGPREQWK
jgi:HK97 family phage major capsid protein